MNNKRESILILALIILISAITAGIILALAIDKLESIGGCLKMIKPITPLRAKQIAERLQALEPNECWTPEEVIKIDRSARHKIAGLLATHPDLKEIFRSFLAMFHEREMARPGIFKQPNENDRDIYRPWEEEPLEKAWDVADPFGT